MATVIGIKEMRNQKLNHKTTLKLLKWFINSHILIEFQVDEGIEAMLCCWLQQLQEFGGPEVEKPDLLKGSIGSLKNIGLPNAKNSSNPSLTRHNTLADVRARYNVSQKYIR